MITLETPTYYTATKKYDLSFPSLADDIEADVVVIGGGFSGINTALELAEKGITNIVVLEARHLGFGGTGRNGGQIVASGKAAGILSADQGLARRYLELGATFVAVGVDTSVLVKGLQTLLANFKDVKPVAGGGVY